ncbi:MAG: two-component regulator propeller domain-containing protein [Bacteroidota bacterium]
MKKFIFFSIAAFFLLTAKAQIHFTNYTNFNSVTCLLEVGNNIWCGTEGGICVRAKSNGNVVATYTTNNGLSNNYIFDIAQDGAGQIWVATAWGLSVFNGSSWQKLGVQQTGINDYRISCIESDLNGNIWVGTFDGIWHNDGTTWNFFDTSVPGITSGWINDIDVDNSGNLWFAAGMPGVPGGVIRFDGMLWSSMTSADGLASDFVETIAVDAHDAVWIGHYNSGIDKFKSPLLSHYDYTSTSGGLINDWIFDIDFDASGNMWAATNDGVSTFNGTIWTHNNIWYSSGARAILVDAQNNKWDGTYSNGLARYNASGWTQFTIDNSLVSNDTWSIIEESPGSMLFGTNNGLSRLTGFNTWTNYGLDDGLTSVFVECMSKDANDSIFIGTNNGLFKFNGTSFGPEYLPTETVKAQYYDAPTATLWVGTTSGLYKFNSGAWTQYTTADGLPDDFIWAITKDGNGNLWIGTNTGGLVKYDGSSFLTYNTLNSGLLHDWVMDIAVDQNEILWIITHWGMCSFDGTTWTNWPMGLLGLMTTPSTVSVDAFNNKWVGMNADGLAVYNGSKWQLYQVKDGLVSNTIRNIYYNPVSKVHWIGTRNGVSKMECVPPVADFKYDTACYNAGLEPTYIYSTSTVIDTLTRYAWDIDEDGVSDYFTKNISHVFSAPGYYNVRLIASNYSCNDTITKQVWINTKPQVTLQPSGTISLCQGSSIFITTNTNEDTTVFLNESFNSMSIPTGWTQVGLGAANWFVSNTASAGGTAPELIFSYSPQFIGESIMSSLPVNTAGSSSLVLTFRDMMSYYSNSYTIGVKTSTDGITWNTVWSQLVTSTIPAQIHSIPISNVDVGSPTFRIGFFFNGDSWDNNYWYIDDVVLSKYGSSSSGNSYSYLWSNGETTKNITTSTAGKYSVIVSSANCYTYSDTVEVIVSSPFAGQELCMVTVDTLYGKNMIMWEKPVSTAIESFKVYKETTIAGFYQLLETVPYDSSSFIIDYFSNPVQRSDRYKISVVDTCGNESDKSTEHRTIQLAVSQGVPSGHHLHWNSYEGFPYGTFYIWQGLTTSTLVKIDSIQSSLNDQTYTTPPAGELYYLVTIKKADSCNISLNKASSGTYTTSVSNMEQFRLISDIDEEGLEQISLMPNPANTFFTLGGIMRPVQVCVMDVTGKIIFETSCKENSLKISTDSWAAGMYTLRVTGEKNIVWKKVIVKK